MVRTLSSPRENQGLHQLNMAESLAHRANVASVHQDLQLLRLLQKEQQQLESLAPGPSRRGFWQRVRAMFVERTQVSIEKIEAPSGQVAWRVHDPRTGRSRYAETSAEIVGWLEASHLL